MDEQTKAAIKVFVGLQLVMENAKAAIKPTTEPVMQVRFNKIRGLASIINKDFWKVLGDHEESVFQDKMRRIESIIEE